MRQKKMTPLRERMLEDMRIHGTGDKPQKAHIRAIKDFSGFLGRSTDTATPDDLRAYQLHMTDTEVTPPTFNARIMALSRDAASTVAQLRLSVLNLAKALGKVAEACRQRVMFGLVLIVGCGPGRGRRPLRSLDQSGASAPRTTAQRGQQT